VYETKEPVQISQIRTVLANFQGKEIWFRGKEVKMCV